MASQDAKLTKFEANFKQQQSEMTNKIDTVLKAITNRIARALPSDTVKNPKLSTSLILSARSYLNMDSQCSNHLQGSINTVTIHLRNKVTPMMRRQKRKRKKKRTAQKISMLVLQSSDTEVIYTKGDNGEVMFNELIRKNDESSEGEHKEEGSTTTEGIELHETQLVVKQLHSVRMLWFEQLETQLSNLYHNKLSHAADAFKPAFLAFFGAEHQTFGLKMFQNLDQLKLQFKRENLHEVHAKTYVLHESVLQYGILRMKENELNALKENGIQAMDDSVIVSKSSLIEPENNNAFSKSEIETQMQRQEEKINMREAIDAGLVVTESSGTKPDKQDTSSSSGNYTTQAVDADIGPVNDDEPFAEVQLTALHNILANEQQHTEQSEPSYDTHLLETIDSNTTPTSTNMCHRGGEIDQDALLKTELLKTKDMVDKEIYNELSKRFLQLEKHCISLEIQIQQKEESFQSNKPCKNQEFPEFREFFVINDLKAQLLARTTLICNLKKQIKSVKETNSEFGYQKTDMALIRSGVQGIKSDELASKDV
ncbi:hypothetical protein Tco_1378950 [Tanacetum coccineum]